jgi:aminoglycoside phosphotransferase (APT) family kinase protein
LIKKDAPTIEIVTQVLRDHLKSSDFKVERVLSGVSTYVYRVQLGENIFYLRVLPELDMSFAVEIHIHSLLRQNQVQVPEVIHFEHHNEALGMSMMLVREILGSNIEDCPTIEEYGDILFKAGKQIAVINQVRVDGFGWIKRDKEESGNALQGEKGSLQDIIYEFLDKDLFLLSENIFHKDVISQIRSTLHTGTALMLRHPSHLIHGDFDDSHIFSHNGSFTGIIDFGEIQGNSPLYDLGHFKLHDGQRYLGYNYLAEGYNEVRALSYDDQIEIDLWALWVGIRRLGMVYKRTWGRYHDHLIKTLKLQIDRLNKKL